MQALWTDAAALVNSQLSTVQEGEPPPAAAVDLATEGKLSEAEAELRLKNLRKHA